MRLFNLFLSALIGVTLIASQAIAQSKIEKNLEWKQCNEDALGLRADPAPIQKFVGSDFSLALENGKAMVVIIVQDCSQYWIDGKNLGRNKHVHVWARIEGPKDVRPVVGAAQTLATYSWFSLFAGSTNPRDWQARMASHTSPERIDSASLDPLGWPRGGKVTIKPGLSFSWSVPSATESASLMGINHDTYLRDNEGNIILKRIQALANQVAIPARGTLKVVGAAEPNKLIGAGEYPVLVYTFFPVWARVNLGDDIPK